jgi:TonB family protein
LSLLALAAGAWVGAALVVTTPGRALGHEDDVVAPRLLGEGLARWPSEADAAPYEVLVPVVVHVRDDGTVSEVELERGASPAVDAAALAAARAWRFVPARRGGRVVASKVRGVVRFGRPARSVGASGASGASALRRPGAVPDASARLAPGAAAPEAPSAGPAAEAGASAAEAGAPAAEAGAPAAEAVAPTVRPATEARPVAPRPVEAAAAAPAADAAAREVRVVGEAPARSASAVTRGREVIGAAPHRTGGDVLRLVPGMTVTQHGGEGKAQQVFYRGFDAVHGQDVEFWVAGAPANDVSNVHGQGYADLHFVMPEVVASVRAQPGPYDVRQGDFAVAGTVRLGLGYGEPGVTAKAQAGSFGSRRYFLAYHPAAAGAETFAAVETYATDGFGPARAARRHAAVAQARVSLGGGASLVAMASAYATRFDSAGVVRARDVESGALDRFATYDPGQGGHSARAQAVLELSRESERERWSFAPFFVARSLGLRSNFTGRLVDPVGGDLVAQTNDATTFGATASYRRALALVSPRDAVEAGAYARVDRVRQSQGRAARREVDAAVEASDVAGYVDAELRPARRVALRGGARLEGLAYVARDRLAGGAPAPRAAQGANLGKKATADVTLAGGLHALASYGEGFRSPQARSLADGERAPFVRVRSAEAGARYRDGRGFEASVAGFYTAVASDLVFDPAAARNEPAPGTRRVGVAGEYVARARPDLVTSVAVTYARATFAAAGGGYARGELVPYAPQAVVRGDVAYEPELGRPFGRRAAGHLGAGFTYFDARPLPYGEWGRGALVVDARASARVGPVEAGVDLYNAFDAAWYDGEFVYASNFGRGAADLVPARHVTAGPPFTALATLALYL